MKGGLVRWLVLVLACGSASFVGAQTSRPAVVPRIAAVDLAGDWYEAATSGSFALRRCLSDTRHMLVQRSERTLEVRTACVTNRGVERRRGFLEGGKAGDGRLSMRYAPLVLSWAPAAWSDFWVLDVGVGWMVVGDRDRRFLAVWSRTVALDESALARAIASARAAGFDPGVLRRVSQPAGPSGLIAGR